LWNIQYDSLLNLDYKPDTKVITFADDILVTIKGESSLIIENKANIKINKISNWAKNNKITFNTNKTQVMLVSRKKQKTAPKLSIHLNHGIIRQTENMKYLGIFIEKKVQI
jgi:Reverse transcriptase (RNA-dependent DNA polymerase).